MTCSLDELLLEMRDNGQHRNRHHAKIDCIIADIVAVNPGTRHPYTTKPNPHSVTMVIRNPNVHRMVLLRLYRSAIIIVDKELPDRDMKVTGNALENLQADVLEGRTTGLSVCGRIP
jgi:hypothetical protein